MKKDDVIKLSDGQTATIVTGDESTSLTNCYIVRLENEDIRVVDRKTLTLAESLNNSRL
ncbi:bacteriocin [Lactococcus lactis RTB018]|nr:bacteriocin [Lactococcus lactis]OAZ16447.1 bacteriocin [Lactococcus lactis RTB018]